jgi:hypothetical protein
MHKLRKRLKVWSFTSTCFGPSVWSSGCSHTDFKTHCCIRTTHWPTPMAAWPKVWVYSCSLAFLRVGIPPVEWMPLSCECCVLSGRGLCDMPITSPEEWYRMWYVCDRGTSTRRRPWPTGALEPQEYNRLYP